MSIEKDQSITIGVIAALAVGFTLFAWMPLRNSSRAYAERIEAARATLDPGKGGNEQLSTRDREVKALQTRIDEQDRYVPETPELASVLRSLTEAVRGRGVGEHELETLETAHYERYSVIPAQLAFTGDFARAFGVLSDIEAMPRLIRVDRLDLSVSRGRAAMDPANPTVQATMRLSTFHSDTPEPPATSRSGS